MIITRLRGGLGNQMFQYAAALACARRAGVPEQAIHFDLEWFNRHRERRFELDVFGIEVRQPPTAVLALARWTRHLPALAMGRVPRYVHEAHFHYDPAFENCRDGVYLAGYWQSPRYFAAISDTVRSAFRFASAADGRNGELASAMAASNSVCVHVRRGDYVVGPSGTTTGVSATRGPGVHGVLGADYYRSAVDQIADQAAPTHWYVFTDADDDLHDFVEFPGPSTFIRHNRGAHSFRDLELMTHCRHHIVANSSFSWWGAWLAAAQAQTPPAGIVVAPRGWFRTPERDATDLLPPHWLRV